MRPNKRLPWKAPVEDVGVTALEVKFKLADGDAKVDILKATHYSRRMLVFSWLATSTAAVILVQLAHQLAKRTTSWHHKRSVFAASCRRTFFTFGMQTLCVIACVISFSFSILFNQGVAPCLLFLSLRETRVRG